MWLWPGTGLGKALFAASKLWVALFPCVWILVTTRRLWIGRRWDGAGLWTGLWTGLALSLPIVLGYFFLAPLLLDFTHMRTAIADVGLGRWQTYTAGALYWILVNSILEEYVWRWFVFRQFETLVGGRGAVLGSALGFSVHHAIALALYMPPVGVVLACVGIFVGGAVWSWCYLRYRSVWVGYVSHAIVDVTVFLLGAVIVFGDA
jgi:membrane protease YdiL (CAAX protease family)